MPENDDSAPKPIRLSDDDPAAAFEVTELLDEEGKLIGYFWLCLKCSEGGTTSFDDEEPTEEKAVALAAEHFTGAHLKGN